MGPTRLLLQDPCPFGLPELSTVAHILGIRAGSQKSNASKGPELVNQKEPGWTYLAVAAKAQYTDGSGFYKWHTDGCSQMSHV